MKNHKRGGVWVTVVDSSRRPAWNLARMDGGVRPQPSGPLVADRGGEVGQPAAQGYTGRDESVAEFAWCCHELRRGTPPERIEPALTHRAHRRGKRNPESYARRTLRAALGRLDGRP